MLTYILIIKVNFIINDSILFQRMQIYYFEQQALKNPQHNFIYFRLVRFIIKQYFDYTKSPILIN